MKKQVVLCYTSYRRKEGNTDGGREPVDTGKAKK